MARKGKAVSSRRKGRPKRQEADGHIEAILDIATAVILERGFAGASTSEIARRAGASKETFYQRFPNKASLFAALVERKSDAVFATMPDILQVEADPLRALSGFGECLLTVMMNPETQRLHQVVVAEAKDFPELATTFWAKGPGRGRDVLTIYLKELVRQGRMRSKDVEFACEQFLGALFGSVSLRTSLGMPSFLPGTRAIKTWARRTAEAFLRAYLIDREGQLS